jgi:membrane glycosyltransferase
MAPTPLRRSSQRQVLFFSTVVALTGLATWVMADILWRGGLTGVEAVLLVLFVPMFGMVALGFTQALFGFCTLLRAPDPFGIARMLPDQPPKADELPATAIALPIYNEDVGRVYEGLRTMYLDLVRAGGAGRFDFFILSDSTDPNKWIEEEVAWLDLCKQLKGFGRIFYRKRAAPLNRKSGNISDFLRRWGRKYRYMVVLDADSLMEATTLIRLVQLMEVNPQAGIIQTIPAPIQGRTFFARLMQFAGTLYGPVFQAGLNYWQAGSGNFWGHNAIIRVAPFMEHCALPPLHSGVRFMSHDYVEAALMRRAHFEVWLAYELGGSYENLPPTLVDHARRDRRWCRGNLQHSWLLTAQGLHPVNRLHLLLGVLSYLASPLWLIFLLLGTLQCWLYWAASAPPRFDADVGISSFLDIGGGKLALLLFLVTLGLLTLPKMLAVAWTLRRAERRRAFGGALRLVISFAVEHLLSALIAPILMLFNTRWVIEILLGRDDPWNPQRRDAGGGVDWGGILIAHAAQTLLGVVWALAAWHINPAFFWWISPITFGLIGSIPLSALLGYTGVGDALKRLGLLCTPLELTPNAVIAHLEKNLEAAARRHLAPPAWLAPHHGVMQAVLDPYINATHVSLLRQKRRQPHAVTDYLHQLQDRLVRKGPADLQRREQLALLMNADAMTSLHHRIWHDPEAHLAPWWKLAMRHYNTLTDRPPTALYR